MQYTPHVFGVQFIDHEAEMGFISKIRKLNRKRNDKTKQIKKSISSFILKKKYRNKTKFVPAEYQSACIFMHYYGIGDAMIASGLIASLKNNNIKVHVVIREELSFLFPSVINVDGAILLKNGNYSTIETQVNLLDVDLVIDFFEYDNDINMREKTLFAINPRHSIGFNHPKSTMFDTIIKIEQSEHVSNRMTKVLSMMGIEAGKYQMAIDFSQKLFPAAYEFADKLRADGNKIIIVNPYGSQKTRCLNDEQIKKVLCYFDAFDNYTVILFDMGRYTDVQSFKNVMVNPFKDAGNSFVLVSLADIVVTVDTSVVHVASHFAVPQYCLYNNRVLEGGYENNIVWAPNSDKAIVLTTDEHVKTGDGDDMGNFNIDILIDAIESERKNNIRL